MVVKNLKNSREYILELKQKDIALFFKKSPSTISGWENGYDTIPIESLIKYANTYKLSLDFLFGLSEENRLLTDGIIDKKVLSKKLRELRLKNNFRQIDIAKSLNIGQSAYSHYETGKNIITTTYLYALTKIYDFFSIDELFDREEITNKIKVYQE